MLEVISELVLASVTALFILPNLSVVSLGDSSLRVNPDSPQSPSLFLLLPIPYPFRRLPRRLRRQLIVAGNLVQICFFLSFH